ncbi:MAG: glycosyl hydrolase 115 family protein [Longimicrobiales bacterium]|nr:glycosyl hydrolase 115 family protein [Longimicrobiales bacterium]
MNRSLRPLAIAAVIIGTGAQIACQGSGPETARSAPSAGPGDYIATAAAEGRFPLAEAGRPAAIHVDPTAPPGVDRAAASFRDDVARVTGTAPALLEGELSAAPPAGPVVIIGTLGSGGLVDRLAQDGVVDTTGLAGRREAFALQVVDGPVAGVDRALVIAGSDRRGTIYGVYDLSQRIGVSPWYWWADVPVDRHQELHVLPGRHYEPGPEVRYRGIFINDEAPALSGWAHATFGGFNAEFYAHVYELILRLKGNFLWPAMWGRSLWDDDPRSAALADEYGVVLGTSHHEPMERAHVEWERYGEGPWSYEENEARLRAFWREGIERRGDHETLVTIGMRGDGDMPMSEDANIALLERIVADQRAIIEDVTGEPAAETPQVWALYKEVQEYYDRGMTVPDDVTLLFADDNWGNIRRLPDPGAEPRPGGYGVYYHFDYVGDPRNYKWINTSQISRVWEQMHLAWEHGVDRIWIVNVGDIKPMELPISFFLEYAWDPDRLPADRLPEWTRSWAAEQFGAAHADAIADILNAYTRYNSRRKPELLSPDTWSLHHYREAERVLAAWRRLEQTAAQVRDRLPERYHDAYYQLVQHPVEASANLNALYVTVARNRLYARQGRAATDPMAERARALFERDAEITRTYHEEIAGGKWDHMMSQTHIGYTYWQQPEENVMPDVEQITLPEPAAMGVAVEGSSAWSPGDTAGGADLALPAIDRYRQQTRRVVVFNRGRTPFDFTASAGEPWLRVQPGSGTVDLQDTLRVSVDWDRAPSGTHRVPIEIRGPDGRAATVTAVVRNPASPDPGTVDGFVESDGYVAMEAEHYTRAIAGGDLEWLRVPGLGRTGSSMTLTPVTHEPLEPGGSSPRLEYRMHLFEGGDVTVYAYLSPTLDYDDTGGLRYGVSIDDGPIRVVNVVADTSQPAWEQAVANNIRIGRSTHTVDGPGPHVLRLWAVDPGAVFQRIVVDTGGLEPSYLGPPESWRRP